MKITVLNKGSNRTKPSEPCPWLLEDVPPVSNK